MGLVSVKSEFLDAIATYTVCNAGGEYFNYVSVLYICVDFV